MRHKMKNKAALKQKRPVKHTHAWTHRLPPPWEMHLPVEPLAPFWQPSTLKIKAMT